MVHNALCMKRKTNDMNKLKDDLNAPLGKVQRWWIRKPVVLLFTLLTIPIGALCGAYEMTKQLCKDCW